MEVVAATGVGEAEEATEGADTEMAEGSMYIQIRRHFRNLYLDIEFDFCQLS